MLSAPYVSKVVIGELRFLLFLSFCFVFVVCLSVCSLGFVRALDGHYLRTN
jgi:hypothetical protein